MPAAGQLLSEWQDAQDIEKYVVLGDLLELRRVAYIAGAPHSIYKHWAVYIGRHDNVSQVVHLSGEGADFNTGEGVGNGPLDALAVSSSGLSGGIAAEVRCDSLAFVAGDDLVRVNNTNDVVYDPFPPTIVVERATSQLGAGDYNLILNNCEHFVKWCRYGNSFSDQAVVAKSVLLGTGLAALGASPMVAFGAGMAMFTLAMPLSKLINRYYGSNFSLF